MKLTKTLMAAGLALTIGVSAQDANDAKKEGKERKKPTHQRRGGRDRGRMDGGGMMRGMDPAEAKKRLEEIRKTADADGDGKLTGDEKKAFYKGMQEAWAKQKEEFMTKWDKDGDGELNEEERNTLRLGKLDEEFKRLDTNGDGTIDKKEFIASKEAERKGWEEMGQMFRGMRGNRGRDGADDGKAMIERFDENGDGKVDEKERLKAAQAQLERMERKGLTGEWKEFDKDNNGTLSQTEKDALVLEIAERLKKKTEGRGDKATKIRKQADGKATAAPAEK